MNLVHVHVIRMTDLTKTVLPSCTSGLTGFLLTVSSSAADSSSDSPSLPPSSPPPSPPAQLIHTHVHVHVHHLLICIICMYNVK